MKAFRLAIRVEGLYWVAYIADMGTMEGATVIGSIAMAAANDPGVKAAFMATMQMAVEVISPIPIESWNAPVKAPESERSGNA